MRIIRFFFLCSFFSLVGSTAFSKQPEISPEVLKQRDPFKKPIINIAKEGHQSELELFPLEKIQMLGVMTGGQRLTAMVRAPNGKTYFVREKMPIGDRRGIIKKITDQQIVVREKVVNVLGMEETVNSTIELPSESKMDVKKITSEKGW